MTVQEVDITPPVSYEQYFVPAIFEPLSPVADPAGPRCATPRRPRARRGQRGASSRDRFVERCRDWDCIVVPMQAHVATGYA